MKKFNDMVFRYLVDPAVKITGVALLLIIILQIFGRSFMAHPPAWTEEMSRFIFLWYCFLGCAETLRAKQHLGLDYFYNKFGKTVRDVVDVIIQLLTLVFGVYCAFYGYQVLGVIAKRVAPITRLSMKWFYLVLPIMGALFALIAIENLIEMFKGFRKAKESEQT